MEVLHDTLGFSIAHDAARGLLHITWQGAHPGRSAQHCCEHILVHVKATGSTRILNDGTHDANGWDETIRWAAQEFFPQLAGIGITAVAWVTPHNLRAQAAMNSLLAKTTEPIITTFGDLESAYAWLCKDGSCRVV